MRRRVSTAVVIVLAVVITADAARAEAPCSVQIILPLPDEVAGVSRPVISLNGRWRFAEKPPESLWENRVVPSSWPEGDVPGELWMQGIRIKPDVEYVYKRAVAIPADFGGQRVFLRFDGVYSFARVWVNGKKAGEHYGGFTSWNVEITALVSPGENAWITVGVTDLRDDISFASRYAGRYYTENTERLIGGILRDVFLVALPKEHVTRLHVETDLDDRYEDARLSVALGMAIAAGRAEVRLALTDPDGGRVSITPSTLSLTRARPQTRIEIPVAKPKKWDAEHPNLYRLDAEVWIGGRLTEGLSKRFGFREIQRIGPKLLVNGREVKLRGGCRHSAHPLLGRAEVPPDLLERDIQLYKKANFNYIRTSHYPASPRFLDLADEYGLYVEEEMAICWLNHHASDGVLDDVRSNPKYRAWFLSAIAETIERDRSHPSILIWSLENESTIWGTNFTAERDCARRADPTRPLKVGHNAYTGPKHPEQIDSARKVGLDIDSYHYPAWDADFGATHDTTSLPRLFDEYAHVATYNFPTLVRDPGVRDFWGESLKRFWERMFAGAGTLGGAIWATIDDVFEAPDDVYGYGQWGIFDGWRRPKPEYWHAKKAYSPVRIREDQPLDHPGAGRPLRIPVGNWFDHTNLNELAIAWRVGGEQGALTVDVPPRMQGALEIPARAWADGDRVRLTFERHDPRLTFIVDEFELMVGRLDRAWPQPGGPTPTITEDDAEIRVSGGEFVIAFDKRTGLIARGEYKKELVLAGGPHLNLSPYIGGDWALDRIEATRFADRVVVHSSGTYGPIGASFRLEVFGDGTLLTSYAVRNLPPPGTFDEVGVTYDIGPQIDRLSWERVGLWSVYPDDHIGRTRGTAGRMRPAGTSSYRQEPTWSWAQDTWRTIISSASKARVSG